MLKDFHSNIDHKTWDINGSKIKFKFKLKGEKECVMTNQERFRITADCVFA